MFSWFSLLPPPLSALCPPSLSSEMIFPSPVLLNSSGPRGFALSRFSTKSLEAEHRSSVGFLSPGEARAETKGREVPLWPGREGGTFPDGIWVFLDGMFLLAAHPSTEQSLLWEKKKKKIGLFKAQMNCFSSKVPGSEILMRLQHPGACRQPPAQFTALSCLLLGNEFPSH